jgi:hypothetical protein
VRARKLRPDFSQAGAGGANSVEETEIEIPRNLCTFFEFDRATELIEFGYRRIEEALSK